MRFFHAPVNAFPILAAAVLFASCSDGGETEGSANAGDSGLSFAPDVLPDAVSTLEDVLGSFDVLQNDKPKGSPIDRSSVRFDSLPEHGDVVLLLDGTVSYEPDENYYGPDSFTYSVANVLGQDAIHYSETALVSIDVVSVNDIPVIDTIPGQSCEEIGCATSPVLAVNLVALDLLPYVSDVEQDITAGDLNGSTVAVSTQGVGGVAVVDNVTGVITYTPNDGFFGVDTFAVTLTTSLTEVATSEPALVTVEVVENVAPVANSSAIEVTENGCGVPTGTDFATVVVADNATDDDGVLGDVVLEVEPMNGQVVIVGGELTYTPDLDYFGADAFAWRVIDDDCDQSNLATVAVTVTEKLVPVAQDSSATINENGCGAAEADNIATFDTVSLIEDLDGDLDFSTLTLVGPTNGSVSKDPVTFVMTYTPNDGFSGQDSFTWTVADDDCDTNIPASVVITVEANVAPIATDTAFEIAENGCGLATAGNQFSFDVTGVAIDTDGDIDLSTLSVVGPTSGTLSVAGRTVTYIPNVEFTGDDSFTWTINDDDCATSNQATVSISVVPNQAPVALDASVEVDENGCGAPTEDNRVSVSPLTLVSDADGEVDFATLAVVSGPSNGTLAVVGEEVIYTPVEGFSGADSFTWTIEDDDCDPSNVATVNITVTPNDAPTADSSATSVDEIGCLTADTNTVEIVATFSDTDGDVDASTLAASDPANGTVSVNLATSTITYTPDVGFSGADTFTWTVADDDCATSNDATVTVSVTPNDAPTANNEAASVDEIGCPTADTNTVDIVLTFSDTDGVVDASTVSATDPANGSISVDPATSTITYTPDIGYSGPDSFTWTVADDDCATSNVATVNVTVAPNAAPQANDASVEVDEIGCATAAVNTVSISPLSVVNDVDGEVDFDTLAVIAPPVNGAIQVVGENVIYTPNEGFAGFDSFTWTIDDDDCATSNVATVEIQVKKNVVPVANNVNVDVDEIGCATTPVNQVTVDPSGLSSDDDGTIVITSHQVLVGPADGTLDVDPVTFEMTYTPDETFVGVDSFTWQVDDDDCDSSNPATVTVNVIANTAPVAADVTVDVDEIGCASTVVTDGVNTVTISPLSVVTDDDDAADISTLTPIANPVNGFINIVGDDVVYTPNVGFVGQDSFTWTINDDDCDTSNIATVTINVTANTPPVALDFLTNVVEGDSAQELISATDSDGVTQSGDGSNNITVVSQPVDEFGNQLGTVAPIDLGGGAWGLEWTPSDACVANGDNLIGVFTATYTVDDDDCDTSNVATWTIDVSNVVDAAIGLDDTYDVNKNETTRLTVSENDFNGGGWDTDGDCFVDSWGPDEQVDPESYEIVGEPSNGSVVVEGGGNLLYYPNQAYVGPDSLSYTCKTFAGQESGVTTVTLNIVDANTPPIAVPDADNVLEDSSVATLVTGNDQVIDSALDLNTLEVTSQPANGVAVANLDGTITYTPNPDYCGPDQYEYRIKDDGYDDGNGNVFAGEWSSSVAVEIDVISVNDDPASSVGTGLEDLYCLKNVDVEGISYVFQLDAAGLVAGDVAPGESDCDDEVTRYEIVAAPANGTLVLDEDTGEMIYTPNPNFGDDPTNTTAGTSGIPEFADVDYEDDAFTYRVRDSYGAWSADVNASIRVFDRRTAPFARDDDRGMQEDTVALINVLNNDGDMDRDPESQFHTGINQDTLEIVTYPQHGTLTIGDVQPNPNFVNGFIYTPDPDFTGVDTFEYRVAENRVDPADLNEALLWSDDEGQGPTLVTMTVNNVNDDPVGIGETVYVDEIGCVTTQSDITLGDGTWFDSEQVLGQTGVFADYKFSLTRPHYVTITGPDGDFANGGNTDSIFFDGDPANAGRYGYEVTAKSANNNTIVLGGDINSLSADINEAGSADPGVTATLHLTNRTYVDPKLYVTDIDSNIDFNEPGNYAFTALPGVGNVVLVDVNPDPDANEVELWIEYTPDVGVIGSDTFSYTVSDGDGGITGDIAVTVIIEENTAPEGDSSFALTTSENGCGPYDGSNSINLNIKGLVADGLVNDDEGFIDPDTANVVSMPANGSIVVNANGITYIPDPGFVGADMYLFTLTDDDCETTQPLRVDITVLPNAAPTASSASESIDEGGEVAVTVLAYNGASFDAGSSLANDTDAFINETIDPSTLQITTQPAFGQASIYSEVQGGQTLWRINYNPQNACADEDWWGEAIIGFTVTDDDCDDSNEGFITITVNPTNDAPELLNDDYTSLQGQAQAIDIFANDGLGGGISDDGLCDSDERDDADAGDSWDLDSMQISGATLQDEDGDVQRWVLNNGDGFLVINTITGQGTVHPGGTDDPDASDITTAAYDRKTQCFVGQVSFAYVRGDSGVTGGDGLMGDIAQVTVSFDADGNDCPVASDFTVDTLKNSYIPLPINLFENIAANDDTIDWPTFTVLAAVEHESNGGFAHNEGVVSYMPAARYVGQDSFTYAVQDTQGQWTSATVTINIEDRNTPPLANNDGDNANPFASVDSTSPDTITLAVLDNDIDPDAPNAGGWGLDTGSIEILGVVGVAGSATPTAGGGINFTPDQGESGIAVIQYRMSDHGYDPLQTYADVSADPLLDPLYAVETSGSAFAYVEVTFVAPLVAGGPASADNESGLSQSTATSHTGNGGVGPNPGTGKKPEVRKNARGGVALPKGVTLQQLFPSWQREGETSVAPLASACLTISADKNGQQNELDLITRDGVRTLIDPLRIAGDISGLWVSPNAGLALLRGDINTQGRRELFGLNVQTGEVSRLHNALLRGEQVAEFAVSPTGTWAAYIVRVKGQSTLYAVGL